MKNESSPLNYSGYSVDIINLLAKQFNATLSITEATSLPTNEYQESFGKKNDSCDSIVEKDVLIACWSGVIQKILSKEVDFLIGHIPLSEDVLALKSEGNIVWLGKPYESSIKIMRR